MKNISSPQGIFSIKESINAKKKKDLEINLRG